MVTIRKYSLKERFSCKPRNCSFHTICSLDKNSGCEVVMCWRSCWTLGRLSHRFRLSFSAMCNECGRVSQGWLDCTSGHTWPSKVGRNLIPIQMHVCDSFPHNKIRHALSRSVRWFVLLPISNVVFSVGVRFDDPPSILWHIRCLYCALDYSIRGPDG